MQLRNLLITRGKMPAQRPCSTSSPALLTTERAGLRAVFMFSGQGSHYYQMGRPLYEQHGVFRRHMQYLDELAAQLIGESVVAALYDERRRKSDVFARTLLTHPAIFMVETALARTLMAGGVIPVATLGVSLGSFAAASLAGCITVEEALAAVIHHARVLEACCRKGAMVAVLAEPDSLGDLLDGDTEIAAFNYDSHCVLATTCERLELIEAVLRRRNVTHQRLPVSFAFHSRWIEEAREPFQAVAGRLVLGNASMPVFCCAAAAPLRQLPRGYFWTVTREPIQFKKTMSCARGHGTYDYVDVGPSGTLAAFVRNCLAEADSGSRCYRTLSPYGGDLQSVAALTEAAAG